MAKIDRSREVTTALVPRKLIADATASSMWSLVTDDEDGEGSSLGRLAATVALWTIGALSAGYATWRIEQSAAFAAHRVPPAPIVSTVAPVIAPVPDVVAPPAPSASAAPVPCAPQRRTKPVPHRRPAERRGS